MCNQLQLSIILKPLMQRMTNAKDLLSRLYRYFAGLWRAGGHDNVWHVAKRSEKQLARVQCCTHGQAIA